MCCLCSSECLSISCWCSIICFQCNGVKESPRPRQLYSLILPAKLLLTAVSLFEIQIHGGNFLGWYICYTGETNSPQVHIWKFSFTLSRFNCLVSCLSMWSSLGSVQVHMSLWIPARLNDILKITLKSWSGVSHPHFPFFHPSVLSLFCILSTLPMHHIPEWPPRCHHSNFYPCCPSPLPRPHLCPPLHPERIWVFKFLCDPRSGEKKPPGGEREGSSPTSARWQAALPVQLR